jgi:putative sigma-54 modulation protein
MRERVENMMKAVIYEHFQATDAIKAHVNDALEKITEHLPESAMVSVVLAKTNPKVFSANIRVHVKGKDIIAEETDDDLYRALGLVSDKIKHNILKFKEKKETLRKRSKHKTMAG